VVQGTVQLEDIDAYVAMGDHGHDVDTIGGLVMAELGRRPSEGDEIELGAVRLRVMAVERLTITRVSVHFPPGKAGPAYSTGRSR
jgi:CBS domain containing-hemolysin-like protein